MKKAVSLGIALSVAFSLSIQTSAFGSTRVKTHIANFKKVLTNTNQSIIDLLAEKQDRIDSEDRKLSEATINANTEHGKELLSIQSNYAPQIATANQKAQDAKELFNKNNKIKVGSGGGFFGGTNLANYLDCPAPVLKSGYTYELAKRYCTNTYNYARFGDKSPTNIGAVIGGEDWQAGDETTIQLTNSDQPLVQSGFANGYIVAINPSVFDSSRIEYKNQLTLVDSLTLRQGNAVKAATTKRDLIINNAKKLRNDAVADIEMEYQEKIADLEASILIQENALKAAQRASKDPNNFSQAFATAYMFEFNRTKLNEIADLPWNGSWSFRSINTLLKVTQLADQANSIASKYSFKSAIKFNNLLLGAFSNDVEFRAELKLAQALFSKVTGSAIKLQ